MLFLGYTVQTCWYCRSFHLTPMAQIRPLARSRWLSFFACAGGPLVNTSPVAALGLSISSLATSGDPSGGRFETPAAGCGITAVFTANSEVSLVGGRETRISGRVLV